MAETTSTNKGATWIVVADGGRARVFETRWGNGKLTEIEDRINGDARLRDGAIVSDRQGRSHQGADGHAHSLERHEPPSERAEDAFARELCADLVQARKRGDVARLYLVAEPTFLGRLRRHLDDATQRIVVQDVASDLTRHSPEDIRKALPRTL